MSRNTDLLRAMAHAFEEGIDPFSTSWLSEHEVTGQECYEMGQSIASIVKGYLASPMDKQIALLAWGVLSEAGFSETAASAMHYHDVVKALRKASQR